MYIIITKCTAEMLGGTYTNYLKNLKLYYLITYNTPSSESQYQRPVCGRQE